MNECAGKETTRYNMAVVNSCYYRETPVDITETIFVPKSKPCSKNMAMQRDSCFPGKGGLIKCTYVTDI